MKHIITLVLVMYSLTVIADNRRKDRRDDRQDDRFDKADSRRDGGVIDDATGSDQKGDKENEESKESTESTEKEDDDGRRKIRD